MNGKSLESFFVGKRGVFEIVWRRATIQKCTILMARGRTIHVFVLFRKERRVVRMDGDSGEVIDRSGGVKIAFST